MKAIQIGAGGGLDTLRYIDVEDPGQPGPGEIRVKLYASSLNGHDLSVATGPLPHS